MSRYGKLADQPFNITFSEPKVLAKAYRDYHRYRVTIRPEDAPPVLQERDVLIAGKVVVVIPIDVARQEIVLIRQFRLPAHFANGHGYLVEFVAGRSSRTKLLSMPRGGNVGKKSALHLKKRWNCSAICVRPD